MSLLVNINFRVLLVSLFSLSVHANDLSFEGSSILVERSYDSLSNDYGDWQDFNIRYILQSGADNQLNIEFSKQKHFREEGSLLGVGFTRVLNDWWYVNTNVSTSNSGFYLPSKRFDVLLSKKWLESKPLISTLGYTYYDAKDAHYDRTLLLDLVYYFPAPWVIEIALRVNDSNPGSVTAIRKILALTYGRNKHRYFVFKIDDGNEAYQLLSDSSVQADFPSTEYIISWREWLSKNTGFTLGLNHYISDNYERNGVRFGLFYDF